MNGLLIFRLCIVNCIWGYLISNVKLNARVTIMGRAVCSSKQMERFLLRHNTTAKRYLFLIPIYLQEGEVEGVRGDLAFAQSLKETNFFKFGGTVQPSQNNFAGLGTVSNYVRGCSFKTAREGVRAQIQHLKAYGSMQALKQPCVDPRFHLPKRKSAPCFEDLGGMWAYPGYDSKKFNSLKEAKKVKASYGDDIVRLWQEMKKEKK